MLLLDEIASDVERARDTFPGLAENVWEAVEELRECTEWMISVNHRVRFSGAVPYLRAFARVLGAQAHLLAALGDKGGAREKLARFYIKRMLPEHQSLLAQARAGDIDVYALTADEFAA